jgi:hypothetical protein
MQFRSSLFGRRFPRLQQLKPSRIKELMVAQQRQCGRVIPPHLPTFPKSKNAQISVLVYYGHGNENLADIRGAELLRRQVGLRTVSVPRDNKAAQPIQRENKAWQAAGHAYPGRENWRPNGKFVSREDVARCRQQVLVQSECLT